MNRKKLFSLVITAIFSIAYLFSTINLTSAVNILPPATGDKSCSSATKEECGDYSINDFIVLAVNVSNWILGIVGSLTLVMFIWGGIMFMISGGASDKIGQAKKILIASIVGLVIVVSSWLIINFSISSIGAKTDYSLDQSAAYTVMVNC